MKRRMKLELAPEQAEVIRDFWSAFGVEGGSMLCQPVFRDGSVWLKMRLFEPDDATKIDSLLRSL